jgi:predicted PurR-regulated permease PerM
VRVNVSAPAGDRAAERLAPVLYRAVLLAFALVALLLVFSQVVGLLLLALLVVIIALPLSAATTRLEDWKVPRVVGAPLVLLGTIAVLGGLVALLVPTFVHEGRQLVHSLPHTFESLRNQLSQATHRPPSRSGHDVQTFVNGYTHHPQKLLGPATTIGTGVGGFLTRLVVVLLTALFIAIQPRPLVDGAVRLVAPERRDHARHILRRLAAAYVGWLRGLVIGMVVLFVITYLGLQLVGLPYAVVFATLTALAMVVPYFGALVSAIPPILLGLTISPGKALLVAAVYVISHQVEGNLIEPVVMARAVRLHPALVAVGVLIVERLFGFGGLVVAVPVLVTFKVMVEELWVRPMEQSDRPTRRFDTSPMRLRERAPGRS